MKLICIIVLSVFLFVFVVSIPISHYVINKYLHGYVVLKQTIEKYSVIDKEGRLLFLKTSARYEGMNWYISDEAGSILFAKAIESKKRMFHYQMCNKSIFLKLWIPNRVDNIKLSII